MFRLSGCFGYTAVNGEINERSMENHMEAGFT